MNFPQLGIELQLTSLDSLRNFSLALWDKLHVLLREIFVITELLHEEAVCSPSLIEPITQVKGRHTESGS